MSSSEVGDASDAARTAGDTERLMRAFEDLSLPLELWRQHETHLRVAAWYLAHLPAAEAVQRVRSGIQRFNAAHGIVTTPTSGYHETITLAFVALVRRELARAPQGQGFERTLGGILERLGDSRVLLRHYSSERLMSVEARRGWVEPDLSPI